MDCEICYVKIKNSKEQVNCPSCGNSFHKKHLAYWLLNNDICPVCRTVYSNDFLDNLRPKTHEERIEVEKSELEILNSINKRKMRRTMLQWILIIPFFFVELYLAYLGQFLLIIILLVGFLFIGIPKGEKSHYKRLLI